MLRFKLKNWTILTINSILIFTELDGPFVDIHGRVACPPVPTSQPKWDATSLMSIIFHFPQPRTNWSWGEPTKCWNVGRTFCSITVLFKVRGGKLEQIRCAPFVILYGPASLICHGWVWRSSGTCFLRGEKYEWETGWFTWDSEVS